MNLFEADTSFFTMLGQQANLASQAASGLSEIAADPSRAPEVSARLNSLFEEQRRAATELLTKVDRTFVTPLDKEDFHPMVRHLEKLSLSMTDVAELVIDLKLTTSRPDFVEATAQLAQLCQVLEQAMPCLSNNLARLSEMIPGARATRVEFSRACRRRFSQLMEEFLDGSKEARKWSVVFEWLHRCAVEVGNLFDQLELMAVKYA